MTSLIPKTKNPLDELNKNQPKSSLTNVTPAAERKSDSAAAPTPVAYIPPAAPTGAVGGFIENNVVPSQITDDKIREQVLSYYRGQADLSRIAQNERIRAYNQQMAAKYQMDSFNAEVESRMNAAYFTPQGATTASPMISDTGDGGFLSSVMQNSPAGFGKDFGNAAAESAKTMSLEPFKKYASNTAGIIANLWDVAKNGFLLKKSQKTQMAEEALRDTDATLDIAIKGVTSGAISYTDALAAIEEYQAGITTLESSVKKDSMTNLRYHLDQGRELQVTIANKKRNLEYFKFQLQNALRTQIQTQVQNEMNLNAPQL